MVPLAKDELATRSWHGGALEPALRAERRNDDCFASLSDMKFCAPLPTAIDESGEQDNGHARPERRLASAEDGRSRSL
jgi:hypothetical protein